MYAALESTIYRFFEEPKSEKETFQEGAHFTSRRCEEGTKEISLNGPYVAEVANSQRAALYQKHRVIQHVTKKYLKH